MLNYSVQNIQNEVRQKIYEKLHAHPIIIHDHWQMQKVSHSVIVQICNFLICKHLQRTSTCYVLCIPSDSKAQLSPRSFHVKWRT